MDKISLEQLEEMQKELFKKQCYLDIQKAFVKHFIKKKQSEQLSICAGCSEISDEQKQKAYDSAVKLVNEIFDW